MVEVIWANPALDDLNTIAEYIALDNPEAARKLVQSVFARVGQLREFPKSGSVPGELRGLPYRQLVVPPCRVFYRPEKKKVNILHVMRGEQLLRVDTLVNRDLRNRK
jgi:toxin ParE1/3/4